MSNLEEMQDAIFMQAIAMKESDGCLSPIAFVIPKPRRPTVDPMTLVPAPDDNMELWDASIRAAIEAMSADAVITVSESFGIDVPEGVDGVNMLCALSYGMDASDFDGSSECLTSVLESRSGKSRFLEARVLPDGTVSRDVDQSLNPVGDSYYGFFT